MPLEYVWPEDDRFRRFAALIADAVLVARDGGAVIGQNGDEACPMGCLRDIPIGQPGPLAAAKLVSQRLGPCPETWYNEAADFICGFDGYGALINSPYRELGRAYRRRFP
jgi:hypothetical protein